MFGFKIFCNADATTIDNHVFRLHYKATTPILLACSMLVLCRQYFGIAISCMSKDDIPSVLLDTFCWIHATYSLPDAWEKEVGAEVPYPGIGKYTSGEKRVFHTYYQWVWFVLFMQAILFYVPRYFWKAMEGGTMKNLVLGLDSPTLPEETRVHNLRCLMKYMTFRRNNHSTYFISYVLAELMNFVNVVGQIFLVDAFLGGEFLTLGSRVTHFTGLNWAVNPMVKVFPRLTKCTFYRYGSSGDIRQHDAMCILPLNILNEKIYLFLWFWFIILAVLSGMTILYRAIILLWPKSRFMVTRWQARLAYQDRLENIIRKCKIGDWLILDLLSKNLHPLNFRDVIDDVARKVDCNELEE